MVATLQNTATLSKAELKDGIRKGYSLYLGELSRKIISGETLKSPS